MRIRPQQLRVFAAIAMQRVSERDLRITHDIIQGLSPVSFIDLIRDLEDEIENSLNVSFESKEERGFGGSEFSSLYIELDRIRRKDLKVPVASFAELLSEALRKDPSVELSSIPPFDSRRGLQAWIKRLMKAIDDHQIYQAVMYLRDRSGREDVGSVWKLR